MWFKDRAAVKEIGMQLSVVVRQQYFMLPKGRAKELWRRDQQLDKWLRYSFMDLEILKLDMLFPRGYVA